MRKGFKSFLKCKTAGFTLAELLIALAILGVIATFTIPKVLQSQQSSQYNSAAKEFASMLSGAYQAYLQNNTVTANTQPGNFTPYMNYVKVDSATTIDREPGAVPATLSCSGAQFLCLRLHNGGMMLAQTDDLDGNFGGTAATNALWVLFDPDGKASTIQGVVFFLYVNGRISSAGAATGNPAVDPPWFSWS